MTVELYVYYRIAHGDAAAAAETVRVMQAGLRERHPGLLARLLRRPLGSADVQTWMEVYAMPGGIDEALQRQIESAAGSVLQRWIQGLRHCEVFEDFA